MNRESDTSVRIYRLTRPLRGIVPGIEMYLALDGRVRIEAGNTVYRLAEPDVLLLSRRETVRITPEGRDSLLLVLRAAPNFLSFAFGDAVPAFQCDSTGTVCPDCTALRSLLAEAACNSMIDPDGGDPLLFNSVLFRLLHELKRNFSILEEPGGADENEESKRNRMISAYIEKNYRYPLTLDELAEKFSLTPQYLSRWFSKKFGINFHAYLNRLRLESAVKDLVLSGATVTAIAYDNGFPNLNAFLKELKDRTGETPTGYRKARRIKIQESEKDTLFEENGESALVREKLRPYLKAGSGVFESSVIEADAGKGVQYERPWEEVINLGFAQDFTKTVFFDQIKMLQSEAPFRYGRFQSLFGKNSPAAEGPRREYNFVHIDRIINFLYEVKLIPFVELGFKPDLIQGKHGEYVFNNSGEIQSIPIDEYEKLIAQFLKRMANRYGIQEISRWRFEMMAPSGNLFNYTKSDIDTYIEQFAGIRKIIKDIAPSALVGGPGFNLSRPENMNIMAKILHGLEEWGSSPDFFSFYAFSFSAMPAADENEKNALLWEKHETSRRAVWAKKFIQSINPLVKNFYVTEWNLDFSSRNRLHDSLIKAPFILQNCIDAIDSIDVLSYWLASDISAEYSDSNAILFGGPGLLGRYGLRKPSFYAYHFLSRLGPVLLAKGEGYIVTAKPENNYAAIVFNYKYVGNQSRLNNDFQDLSRNPWEFLENLDKLTVSLRLNNIKSGRYKVRSRVLNALHGSVYDAWRNLSVVEELTNTEAAWLERTCAPDLMLDFIDAENAVSLDCELEPNEVRLMEISLVLE